MKSNILIKLMLAFLFATLFTACGGEDNNSNGNNDINISTGNSSNVNDDGNQNHSNTYNPYGFSGATGNMRLKKITTDNSTTQYYYDSTFIVPKIIKIESIGPGRERSTDIFKYDTPRGRLSKVISNDRDSEGFESQMETTTGGYLGLPNGPHYTPIDYNAISEGKIMGTSCKEFSGTYTYEYIPNDGVIQSPSDIISKTIDMDKGVLRTNTLCEDKPYILKHAYTYDDMGRLTKEVVTINEDLFSTDVYEYDSYNRVTRVTTSVAGYGLSIKDEYKYVSEPIGSFQIQNKKEYSYYDLDRDGDKEWNLINTKIYEYEEEECFTNYIPFEPAEIPFLRTKCVF